MANEARYEEALSRGHSYSWDQKWADAIHAFEMALHEFSDRPAPYAGLCMAYFSQEMLDKALENYKWAARYSQGDVIYLRQVADVQERLGQLQPASQTYMAIGEVELRRGVVDQAVANWLRAVRLNPGLLGAHQRLARFYTSQGQIAPAVREYLAIARIFQTNGDEARALQTCQAALKLDPRNPDIMTAIELLQHGEQLAQEAVPAPAGPRDHDLSATLAEMTAAFEVPPEGWSLETVTTGEASPVQDARRLALEQLAEEIFEDVDEEVPLATPAGDHGLSKLERDALISQALDFQTRGLANEAISCYEEAIAGGVTSSAAHFNLGLLYQDKLRFEDAIREFSIAVESHEYRLGSHFALGECYRARGQIDKAVEHFITVLKIVDLSTVQHDQADRLIELYEHLADGLMTKGERDQALAFSNALVDFLGHKGWEDKVKEARTRLDALSGDRIMILGDILTAGTEQVLESLYLSRAFEQRGMYNSAVEEVFRAIAISPDYLPSHIQLAELLAKQGRTEAAVNKFVVIGDTFRIRGDMNGAISMYERVIDVSPLDFSIRARLVDLLKRHGQIDRSLEHYIALGEAYYQLAQTDKARETYQDALKLAPRGSADKKWRPRLLRLIADIDLQRLDWRRALVAYQELRKADPADERTAITLIDLYYKLGQPNLALSELDLYLKQLIGSGRGAKVPGILEDMVSRYPTSVGLVERLVRLYVAQRRQQDAIALLDKLGEAQLDAGETQKAIATITRIVQLSPPNVASYQQLLKQLHQSL